MASMLLPCICYLKIFGTARCSMAEVRREKISQRMKLLQDLVPGYNKVVGKAVMLDEIINYVQSLQRQVEMQPVAS
ncbi:hypothetical protein ZWY2020_019666 [Hordeum vulgare]|nr:hypothetical protein ZWY2020_019666 [Hordeum vulgare]